MQAVTRFWRWLRGRVGDGFRPCSTPWWEDELGGSCDSGKVPVGPRNTWSNLAYGASGLCLWLRFQSPESIVMAGTLVLLTIGSAVYHAVPSRVTNALDHAGMLAVFGALATYAAGGGWIPMLAAAFAGTLAYEIAYRVPVNPVMGTFLWIAGVAGWTVGSRALVVASGVGFALAMAAWQLDKRRQWTGRWGHASWHVGTAVSIGLMYAAQ